jgi:hypothetical protein
VILFFNFNFKFKSLGYQFFTPQILHSESRCQDEYFDLNLEPLSPIVKKLLHFSVKPFFNFNSILRKDSAVYFLSPEAKRTCRGRNELAISQCVRGRRFAQQRERGLHLGALTAN